MLVPMRSETSGKKQRAPGDAGRPRESAVSGGSQRYSAFNLPNVLVWVGVTPTPETMKRMSE
jgi:hypothetical protein